VSSARAWTMTSRRSRQTQDYLLIVSSWLIIGWCIGCGYNSQHGYIKHDEELFPVSGRVMFEGQPAKNATVIFHRKRGATDSATKTSAANAPLNPRGECNEQGEFEIFTYALDDGAPAGEYQVTVSWRDPEGQGREENYPELLPRHFQDPASSGLIATVTADESNDLPPFELKRSLALPSD
jgi:hypothetical protein